MPKLHSNIWLLITTHNLKILLWNQVLILLNFKLLEKVNQGKDSVHINSVHVFEFAPFVAVCPRKQQCLDTFFNFFLIYG